MEQLTRVIRKQGTNALLQMVLLALPLLALGGLGLWYNLRDGITFGYFAGSLLMLAVGGAVVLSRLRVLLAAWGRGGPAGIGAFFAPGAGAAEARAKFEQALQSADVFGPLFFTPSYIVLAEGGRAVVFAREQLVWCYISVKRTNGIATGCSVNLCLATGRRHALPMRKKQADAALHHLGTHCPHVVLGYDYDYEPVYANAPHAFRQNLGGQ